ncbi:MAG: hypothetical protein ACRC92_25220 [Peptostreptococcaceae bacterium]
MKNKKLLSTINLVGFAFLMYASYLFRTNQSAFKQKVIPIFNPSPYAFSIWGLIYLLIFIWIISGYFAKYDVEAMYRKVGLWFIACMVLNGASILVPTNFSPFIIIGALITSIAIYNIIDNRNISIKYRIPFSLLCGWLSVATIVDISEGLKSIGFTEILGIGEVGWANILLVVGCLIAILFTLLKNDILYPIVFIWGYIAIAIENQNINSVKYTSIAMCTVIAIGIIYNKIRQIKKV